MTDPKIDPFETRLQDHFLAPAPDPQFAARLEARLRAEPFSPAHSTFFARRAWVLGLAVVLALAAGVVLAGPGRVLAMLQGLIGYVPGVGMLDLDGSQMLAQPVSYNQDGVTLTVEQVIANPEKTIVVVSLRTNIAGQPVFLERSRLRLPDGTEWFAMNFNTNAFVNGDAGNWHATLEFPKLPPDVKTLTFIWARYEPPNGFKLLDMWQLPLVLKAVSDPQVAPQISPAYSLENASTTVSGFTLQVLEVASTTDRTVVHVRFMRPALPRVDAWPLTEGAFLEDQAGRRYTAMPGEIDMQDQGQSPEIVPCPTTRGQCYALGQHLVFNRVPDSANHLTLTLPRFNISWDPRASFDLDLGASPKSGDSYLLGTDLPLPIGEGVLSLTAARIQTVRGHIGPVPGLTVTAVAQSASNDFTLDALWFVSTRSELIPGAVVWEDGKIPSGVLSVFVGQAQGRLHGPWVVGWDVPE